MTLFFMFALMFFAMLIAINTPKKEDNSDNQ